MEPLRPLSLRAISGAYQAVQKGLSRVKFQSIGWPEPPKWKGLNAMLSFVPRIPSGLQGPVSA